MSASERIFRFLLHCCPPEFRDEYGTEMIALFREQKQQRRAAILWLHLIADLRNSLRRFPLPILLPLRVSAGFSWR
jgi:hypothetical protein